MNRTDKELAVIGDALASALGLRKHREETRRYGLPVYSTVWGTKTGKGLLLSLSRWMDEINDSKASAVSLANEINSI